MITVAKCYETLGLPPNAPQRDVHRAYKRLVLLLHPDRMRGDDASREAFCRVTEAYSVLRTSGQVRRCAACGRDRPVRPSADGRPRCAECLLRRPRGLPMPAWTTVRGVGIMALQAGSAACVAAAAMTGSVAAGLAAVGLAALSLAAMTHAVLTSVVAER